MLNGERESFPEDSGYGEEGGYLGQWSKLKKVFWDEGEGLQKQGASFGVLRRTRWLIRSRRLDDLRPQGSSTQPTFAREPALGSFALCECSRFGHCNGDCRAGARGGGRWSSRRRGGYEAQPVIKRCVLLSSRILVCK